MLLDLHFATHASYESAQFELDIKQSLTDTTAGNPASDLLRGVQSARLTRLAKRSVSTWHNVPSVFIRRQNVGASLRTLIASFVTKKTLTVDTAQ